MLVRHIAQIMKGSTAHSSICCCGEPAGRALGLSAGRLIPEPFGECSGHLSEARSGDSPGAPPGPQRVKGAEARGNASVVARGMMAEENPESDALSWLVVGNLAIQCQDFSQNPESDALSFRKDASRSGSQSLLASEPWELPTGVGACTGGSQFLSIARRHRWHYSRHIVADDVMTLRTGPILPISPVITTFAL